MLQIDPACTIKSLVFMAGSSRRCWSLVRGDHDLHERKLTRALRAEARAAAPGGRSSAHLGVSVAPVGPVGAEGCRPHRGGRVAARAAPTSSAPAATATT